MAALYDGEIGTPAEFYLRWHLQLQYLYICFQQTGESLFNKQIINFLITHNKGTRWWDELWSQAVWCSPHNTKGK